MAHIATKRFTYWGQFGILIAFIGVGLFLGSIFSFLPLLSKMNFNDLINGKGNVMDKIMVPENANALRLMQFISTLFLFFIPAWAYAKICHNKPLQHLGFNKKPTALQLVLVVATMFCALLIIGAVQEIWAQLPFPASWKLSFKIAEEAYNKQVQIMARMNGWGDYLISIFIVAFLPAVFEEIIFRGALQNLLSRWMKAPIWAVVITAIVFSAIHGSFDGFVVRFLLGFILGWFFYRTGNIWLNIVAHFFNNAIGITAIFISTKPGQPVDIKNLDEHYPIWVGAIGVAAVVGLLYYFDKISKPQIDRPGQEIALEGYIDLNNPFANDSVAANKKNI
jgi:uncharacterized protein